MFWVYYTGCCISVVQFDFGPSGVCVLPVAARTNEGGHYFWYFSFLRVTAIAKTPSDLNVGF